MEKANSAFVTDIRNLYEELLTKFSSPDVWQKSYFAKAK